MKIVNKVGLEGEFILRDRFGKIRYPAKHGFSTDEFFLLGEFRALPGETREESVGNFMRSLAEIKYRASAKNLVLDFSGVTEITPEMKADVLRKLSRKTISEAKNIYGTDILKLSDDVVENGVIKSSRISAGLHVHFSRHAVHEWLSEKDGVKKSASQNLLTPSQRKAMITSMDKEILHSYDLGVPLKYRNPGFWEEKSWGFEYRSLPMVSAFTTIDEVMSLVDFAFSLLEKLDK